jgi:hypothetical protein
VVESGCFFDLTPGFAGGAVNEVKVRLAIGTIQADDQVEGTSGVHRGVLWVDSFGISWSSAGLTWRRQYRRVALHSSDALLRSR